MTTTSIIAILLAVGLGTQFTGVSMLAVFSGNTNATILIYSENGNHIGLLNRGNILRLDLDSNLQTPAGCCIHRATPSLSHKNDRLAFVHLSNVLPRREAIAITDLQSKAQQDIFEAEMIWSVSWSPDDDRLAVVARGTNKKQNSLYIIDVASHANHVLSQEDTDINGVHYIVSPYAPPSWNINGNKLAVELRRAGPSSNNSSAGIIVVWDVETGQFQKFADGVAPSWSPDGNRIVFFDDTRQRCFGMKIDGGDRKMLFSSHTRGSLFFPAVWSTDSKRLVLHELLNADLITEIYLLDLSTGRSKRVGKSEVQVVNWREARN